MTRLMLVASILLMASCSSKTAGGGDDCGGVDCLAGEICVADLCVQLCVSDGDCAAGEICTDDLCEAGQRDNQPLITGIAADGTADTNPLHADNHIASILSILGEHLDGVQAVLSDGSQQWDLDICTASATQVDVHFPTDAGTGDYVLTVANQAGTCNQTLPVLQGETGTAGSTGAPGAPGTAGAPGVPCSGCVDADTLADDSVDSANVIDGTLTGADIDGNTTISAADFVRSAPVQRVLWLSSTNMAASKADWGRYEMYRTITGGGRMVFAQADADTVLDSQFQTRYTAANHGPMGLYSENATDIAATQEFVLRDGDRITGLDCYLFDLSADSRVQAWMEKQSLTANTQPTLVGVVSHTSKAEALGTWQIKTQALDETIAPDTIYRLRVELNLNNDGDGVNVAFRGCKVHYETFAL